MFRRVFLTIVHLRHQLGSRRRSSSLIRARANPVLAGCLRRPPCPLPTPIRRLAVLPGSQRTRERGDKRSASLVVPGTPRARCVTAARHPQNLQNSVRRQRECIRSGVGLPRRLVGNTTVRVVNETARQAAPLRTDARSSSGLAIQHSSLDRGWALARGKGCRQRERSHHQRVALTRPCRYPLGTQGVPGRERDG
jgi:hypothetical protein